MKQEMTAGDWVTAVGVLIALAVASVSWWQLARSSRRELARFVYATVVWWQSDGPSPQRAEVRATIYNQAPAVASEVWVEVIDKNPPYEGAPTGQQSRGPWFLHPLRPGVVPPMSEVTAVHEIPAGLRLAEVSALWFEDGNGRRWCRTSGRLALVRRWDWQFWRGRKWPA